jgi:alginate O-acetyltransferase complex protein AlgI
LGLGLLENFNYPYAARNPSDFWRRWHMSLSSWIRDYIYIPLGGNRVAAWRRAVNALLAMALCGLWHGAAWNFAVWGLYHGAGLAVHAAWSKAFPPREGAGAWRGWGAQAANFAFVSYGWLLFFYPMDKVAFYTTRLLGLGG